HLDHYTLHSFPTRRSSDLNTYSYKVASSAQVTTGKHCFKPFIIYYIAKDFSNFSHIYEVQKSLSTRKNSIAGLFSAFFFLFLFSSEENTSELQSRFYLVCR